MTSFPWTTRSLYSSWTAMTPTTPVSSHRCPACKAEIELDDIHVGNDIALCRGCGKTHVFSQLTAATQLAGVDLAKPPKWIRIESRPGSARRITYRRVSPMAIFLVPFTLLWGGGALTGVFLMLSQAGDEPGMVLFALPFLFGTLVLASVTAYMIAGRLSVTLDRGRAKVFLGVGPLGRTRSFGYGASTTVGLRTSNVRVNNVPRTGIAIGDGDKELICFGTLMNEPSKQFMAAYLAEHMMSSRGW